MVNDTSQYYPTVYVNGALVGHEEARVSVFDRGFLRADGIFETFYVANGAPIACDQHLVRLRGSADYIRLHAIPDAGVLRNAIEAVLEANGLDGVPEAALRLTISRGVSVDGPPTVVAFARRLSAAHLAKRTEGVLGFSLPFDRGVTGRDLTRHKTLAYLASSLGQIMLAERTGDPRAEGFFCADGEGLLEGTASNLFIVEGRCVVTPPVDAGILPGTARAIVMELAAACGLTVQTRRVTTRALRAADEVFVTSSTLRVAPVVRFDEVPCGGGALGPTVAALQEAFAARVASDIAAWRAAPS